jgi:DNA-binding response OmpR family regulator
VPRVLLIDDNESLRSSLHRTLVRAGYEVEDAPNGDLALRAYRRQPADVVITDIVMPDKEGLETIRELRRLYPDVKIIAISGGGTGRANDYLDLARRLGASRILAKPFLGDDILALVAEVLA